MTHSKVYLPEKLEQERQDLIMTYFANCDPDADFDEEARNAFFAENASRALKRALRQIKRMRKKLPAGVHV